MRVIVTVTLIGATAGLLMVIRTGLPSARAAEPQQKKKLPPLVVDVDSPLMLDDAGKKEAVDKEVSASVAENEACYVCHANYRDEELVQWHADGDVGCVDCHGKSFAHRNDENNTTPPDVMFPLNEIDASCEDCHDAHDVPASDIVARLQERVPRMASGEHVVCTQCHGRHRLDHRTVVWDRATRKLLTGSKESPQQTACPSLETLKQLAGQWVRLDEQGEPTDKVVSEYRVTAAGSAVVEVLFPGSEHEMVTVYYQDGADLLLTHFCAAGNQPRMKCVAGDDPQVLVFDFVDATNMRSMGDHHMHAGTIKIIGSDRLESQWQAHRDGQPHELVKFQLARKK